ncbi:MAG: hypothetical protein E7032_03090 [Akkermansiaceae bacterium]|nr:hypothetical protein [Akkermansiaceae bacterium]
MKLHLPLLLRKALVAACFAIAPTCTVASAADAYYEVSYADKPSVEGNTSVLPPLTGNFTSLVASGVSVSGSLNGEFASFSGGAISNSNLTLSSSVDIYKTTISDLTCNAPKIKIEGDEDRWNRVSNLTLNRVNDATISHVLIYLGFNAKGTGAPWSDLSLHDSYVMGNVSVQGIDFVSFRDCNFSQGIEGSILGGSNLHIYSTDENSGTGSFFVVGENGFTISKVRDESGIGGVDVVTSETKHRSVIECNGNLTFSNNTKVSLCCYDMVGGGCTINWKSGNLVFDGNDEVILSGNSFASDMPELGLPCSIVSDFSVAALSSNPTARPTLYLNTKEDSASRITFGNVINVASSVSLNKYIDNQKLGTGTIVFSAEEISDYMRDLGVSEALQAAAKVSKIKGDVNLYSGTLQIVDGACLDISGTVNSAPTSIDAESKYRSDGLLKIHPGSTLSVSSSSVGLFYPTSSLKTNILDLSGLDLSGSNASNTTLEIVCNSHPSLFVPVIEVNDRLIISDNSELSIDMSNTSTWDMMPLIKLNGVIEYNKNLGEHDASEKGKTGIDRFFTYSEELPWTKNNASFDLKLDMFDWRNQKDIELTWINNVLYLRNIENTPEWMLAGFNPLSGLKNSYNRDYIMYDVDKPLVYNSEKKKHSNACWLYTSANIISYFLSKYGPLAGKELPDVNAVKDHLVKQYQTQINKNKGGNGTDVLCDWIEGSDMFLSFENSKKYQHFFKGEKNTWAKKFKWKVTELPLLSAPSFQELCSAIDMVRVRNDAPMYMSIRQEIPVAPGEYGPEYVSYHAVTCWGYRHYRSIMVDPSDMDNEDDNLLVFYYTDSDTEPHESGKPYSEMWVKRTEMGWQVIQMNGKKCGSGVFVKGLWCLTESKDALALRQSQVALVQHQSTAVPLTYAGTVQNSQWRSSNRNDSNKRELGSGNVPIETTDYIWRKNAYYVWSYAYFYDDSEDVNGASGCGFAESETSFQFIDEVDGVVIPRENKRITLADELGVQDVTVEGTDFIFSGAGTLKARTLTVSGGLTLEENVRVEDTPVVLQGGSMYVASQDNQIRVSGGSISLSEGGALNCAEIEYTGGSYSLKGCGVNSIVSSDGSGILSALVDFSGATVRFAQIKSLSTDTALNQLLYNSVNATGGLDKYKFDYAIEGANIVANAAELENAQVALHSSALKIEGAGNAGVTIGSYFANANESHSQIVLSEQGKSKVESATATLTTQRNEKTYISQGTELDVAGLSVVTGSSMCNDGDIAGHGNQTQITVQPGAELSGRGHFGVTQILEQGKLQVGDGSGAPVYDALQAQSGSVLTFYVDGTETANGTLHGWGSGTHSLLTVNGDLSIANGTIVQVGCSLDFLNSVATGEVQTLTMIQLSDAPGADTLQALQSGTVLMWDEMGAISGLSNVGADIHDVLWSVGADNTLQLSFIVSSRPEYSLLWSSAGASQTWDTSSRNWQDAAGNQVAYEVGKSVLFYMLPPEFRTQS